MEAGAVAGAAHDGAARAFPAAISAATRPTRWRAECFPHLLRRPDFVEFLKLPAINTRLMALLAEEKQLYESDSAKFFLIANPKCPYHIISKYLGYLSSESLTKLSQGYLFGSFARKSAERLLDQRGKAKSPVRSPALGTSPASKCWCRLGWLSPERVVYAYIGISSMGICA